MEREWAVSESISLSAGLANVHHASPIEQGKGTYPSIVALEIVTRSVSATDRAVAEFAKLLLSSSIVKLGLPHFMNHSDESQKMRAVISKLFIRIQDEVPSVVISDFTEKFEHDNLVFHNSSGVFSEIGNICPSNPNVLWIPLDINNPNTFIVEFESLCENIWKHIYQFSIAGYPGCEGCIDKIYQNNWDEGAHRKSITR